MRRIDTDQMRGALAAALIAFGQQTNCKIVAEGVETIAELQALRELGVHAAQGYHLARPMPMEGFRKLVRNERWTKLREKLTNRAGLAPLSLQVEEGAASALLTPRVRS
jgi:EAL domain-containing protein (putative c-di-GMP-specific phosphodiesterase class I)